MICDLSEEHEFTYLKCIFLDAFMWTVQKMSEVNNLVVLPLLLSIEGFM